MCFVMVKGRGGNCMVMCMFCVLATWFAVIEFVHVVDLAASQNLWISGLSSLTRATDLKAVFSKHGKMKITCFEDVWLLDGIAGIFGSQIVVLKELVQNIEETQ